MMYAKVSEIGWDNPTQRRGKERDLPPERLPRNNGAVTGSDDVISQFWQLWQEMHDQLYRCCLRLMNYNSTDAEDALSQAMLKAREKVLRYAGKIRNLKAWLMQVTRNLCIDIISKGSKEAAGVDSLEWVGETENVGSGSAVDTPDKVLEKEEKAFVIREAIASLPELLHETFRLHFYRQLSNQEIASEQGISYENVCKRISLARKHLKEKLSGYFQGTDGDVRGIREQGAGSREQGAGSREQGAGSREQGAGSREQGERSRQIREAIEVQENQVLEMPTVLVELESVEAIEADIPESVEGFVEPRVVADLAIQETGIVAVDGIGVEGVEAEKTEAKECYVMPGVRVGEKISNDARVSGENQLLSLAPVVLSSGMEQVTGRGPKEELAQPSCGEKVVSWLRKFVSLPEPLHETFSLHFYRQFSHKEIASEQGISYENVCKRISLARKHLKERLSGYFRGTDGDVRGISEQGAGSIELEKNQKWIKSLVYLLRLSPQTAKTNERKESTMIKRLATGVLCVLMVMVSMLFTYTAPSFADVWYGYLSRDCVNPASIADESYEAVCGNDNVYSAYNNPQGCFNCDKWASEYPYSKADKIQKRQTTEELRHQILKSGDVFGFSDNECNNLVGKYDSVYEACRAEGVLYYDEQGGGVNCTRCD